MTPQEQLRQRTKKFALQVICLCRSLPNNSEGWVIGKQLLRSGTSVAANSLLSIFSASYRTARNRESV
jgi:four helix bundle protein